MPHAARVFSLGLLLVFAGTAVSCCTSGPVARAEAAAPRLASIVEAGARGDGDTLNTGPIQALIDRLAAEGGGMVLVPPGVFVSGALFFKPGVKLRLERGAVLRCSTDLSQFPPRRTRIEGH